MSAVLIVVVPADVKPRLPAPTSAWRSGRSSGFTTTMFREYADTDSAHRVGRSLVYQLWSVEEAR